MHREICRKFLEHSCSVAGFHRYRDISYLIKCIASGHCLGFRYLREVGHILYNCEPYLSTLHNISKKVVHRQTSRHNSERHMISCRSILIDRLIQFIVQGICHYLIITCKQLELVTSETELSRLIICSTYYECLRNKVVLISEGHLKFCDVPQIFDLCLCSRI